MKRMLARRRAESTTAAGSGAAMKTGMKAMIRTNGNASSICSPNSTRNAISPPK